MYNGQTPSRKRDEYWNGNIRWLSSGELNRGIVYSSIETITEEGKKSANLRVVPKGTFVMAITGLEASGTRGNCALLGFDTTLNQSCMALFPKQDILISQFLFQWYRMVGEEYGINYTQGTKQQSYNAELIKILPILLPSIDEQKKIASYLNSIDHLITLHQRKNIYFYEKVTLVWEQRKLGDVLVSLQNNTLSRADLSNEAGVAKNVHYGDVLIKFGEVLDVSKEQLPMISDESILTKYKTSFLQNGDVIIADTAEDTTVGKCSEIVGLNDEVVLSGLHTIPYRPVEKFAPKYLGYYLNSDAYHNQLLPLMQGIKVTSISKSAMQDTDIIYPKSKEEQTEIGNYFDALDHLITLHQCKCHLLHKLLHNDWEQRKLEDIMDTVTDYVAAGSFEDIRNNVTYLNEPGYAQLVRTVDLKKKFTNNDSIYVDESAFKYLWRVNLNEECIVLPNIGANIGEVYFVEPSGLPYDNNVLGPNAILLKANEDTYFAFTALNNLTFQKQLFENVGSSGQPKFNKTELKSIQLYMPQNEEQEKIGQYFRDLDHLITLHHRKYIYILKSP